MSERRYRTIVADPPWPVHAMRRANVLRGDHYPTMTLDEIKALAVADFATEDAHLYCWAVLPMMGEAYDVVRGWGFAPITLLTWCKPGPGLGGGYRGNTEHLIVARRGEVFYNPTCSTCGGRARGHLRERGARPSRGGAVNRPASVSERASLRSLEGALTEEFPGGASVGDTKP